MMSDLKPVTSITYSQKVTLSPEGGDDKHEYMNVIHWLARNKIVVPSLSWYGTETGIGITQQVEENCFISVMDVQCSGMWHQRLSLKVLASRCYNVEIESGREEVHKLENTYETYS